MKTIYIPKNGPLVFFSIVSFCIVFLLPSYFFIFKSKSGSKPEINSEVSTTKNPDPDKNTTPPMTKCNPDSNNQTEKEHLIPFKSASIYYQDKGQRLTIFSGENTFSIRACDYPTLFESPKEWKEFDLEPILAFDEIYDKKSKKYFIILLKKVIILETLQGPTYVIFVDPLNGKVVFERHLSSDRDSEFEVSSEAEISIYEPLFYVFSDCGNCMRGMDEYFAYDPKLEKFSPSNDRHVNSLRERLEFWNKDAAEKKCEYYGGTLSINEVYAKYGKDARCAGGPPGYLITVGEFMEYKNKLQKLINGEIKSMFDD